MQRFGLSEPLLGVPLEPVGVYRLQVPHRNATYEPLGRDLFKLTLSEENKAELFEYGTTKLTQSQHETSSVLQNLARWDPATRSLFDLRSASTILDTPFRLIFPNSDISSFDETGFYVRQYMAVSYCWRSDDFLPKGYERHGDWPVSKAFSDAIIDEKDHPRVGIWMDQLCIDQASTEDKRKSVAAMDIIYRSCIRLLVLLEDVFLDEEEVALCSKYDRLNPDFKFDPAWRPPPDEHTVFASFYNKVKAARWWGRAWCFHEFNVNEPWNHNRQTHEIHNATFITYGPAGSTVKIKWFTLHYVMSSVPSMIILADRRGQEIFNSIDIGDREPGWRGSIVARHNAVGTKGSMYLKDKISILINMSGLGLAYRGGAVESKDEVLYISTLLALATGERYPLTMFDGRVMPRLNDMSTWLQRNLVADDITIPKFKLGGLHGIHRITMEEIELDMVFLPSPASWQGVTDDDLHITSDIFPRIIPTTRPATHGLLPETYLSASESDEDLDKARRRFLAGCILNGHTFVARLWAQLNEDVVGPNYNQGLYKDLVVNPSLFAAAQRLMAHLLPTSTLPGIQPPSTFTLEDAHLFLTWLTDPRSMFYICILTYRIQCAIDGSCAFSTQASCNEHFNDGPFEEVQAAVPIDLLRETCIPLRIWLLRPDKANKEGSRWKLAGKAMLLGEPDLMAEAKASEGRDNAVVALRRVVVTG